MPVTMTGSPTKESTELALAQMSKLQKQQMDADGDGLLEAHELAAHGFTGVTTHIGKKNVMPAAYRAVQLQPNAFVPSGPKSRQPMNIEATHYGKHMLDLALETELGICPPEWSTTSQMNDTRPNGRSMFDARHVGSPMGRARGGHAMEWDPTGVAANRGKLAKAINKDSAFFAADMADETAAAEKSADLNKYGNNTNFSSFNDNSMMLAQMSKLQRKQMDKDGDGNLDAAELAAHGFHGMK